MSDIPVMGVPGLVACGPIRSTPRLHPHRHLRSRSIRGQCVRGGPAGLRRGAKRSLDSETTVCLCSSGGAALFVRRANLILHVGLINSGLNEAVRLAKIIPSRLSGGAGWQGPP